MPVWKGKKCQLPVLKVLKNKKKNNHFFFLSVKLGTFLITEVQFIAY